MDETFGTVHIALTALITGVLAFVLAFGTLRDARRSFEAFAIGLLAGLSVFLWRQSANMPQLNQDGLRGFSANDWLAPVVVYIVLACYGGLRQLTGKEQFDRVHALAAVVAMVVNVVTI